MYTNKSDAFYIFLPTSFLFHQMKLYIYKVILYFLSVWTCVRYHSLKPIQGTNYVCIQHGALIPSTNALQFKNKRTLIHKYLRATRGCVNEFFFSCALSIILRVSFTFRPFTIREHIIHEINLYGKAVKCGGRDGAARRHGTTSIYAIRVHESSSKGCIINIHIRYVYLCIYIWKT